MTNTIIDKAVERFDRFLRGHVNYLVGDASDPRVGLLSQDIVRGVFKKELKTAITKTREDMVEKVGRLKKNLDSGGYNQAISDVVNMLK